MTSDEVKTALAKAVKRAWPGVAKASDLPFPEYWKGMTEWLVFHAPRVGDELMGRLVRGVVEIAVEAERKGETPVANVVPEETRAIWAKVEERRRQKDDAWRHAAERAASVRGRFDRPNAVRPSNLRQKRFL